MTEFDQQSQFIVGIQQNAGRDIINHYLKAPWEPSVMLPLRAQPFVGREEDLAWLLLQLSSAGGMVITLCGPSGMGKTALAAEVLSKLVAQPDWLTRFPGGIFYHSFYTYPSLAVAFEEIARLFEEEPGADPRRAAVRALSRRRTLLVFDGVEVLEDPLPLRDLGVLHIVLLLSRRQSDAPDLTRRHTLDLLSPNQAITLLQKLAGPWAADRLNVERLVEHIGGYPLALQLIGSYLSSRQETVADYLQWFESEGLMAVHYGKHQAQSVTVLPQRTYDSLTSSEQQAFVLLGLFAPAPFPLELMQDILELPERAVRQVLGSLINLSVLRRPTLGYEVSHPLVHTFATEWLLSHESAASFINIWRERLLATLVTHFEQSDPYLEQARAGNLIVVWRLGRLGRSLKELIEVVSDLAARGIELRSLKENIDTSTPTGKLMFHVIAALAEFERDIIQERTLAGLEAARARGRKGGRPKATSTIRPGDLARARALYAARENTVAEIMQLTGFKNRSTFYKYVVNAEKEK